MRALWREGFKKTSFCSPVHLRTRLWTPPLSGCFHFTISGHLEMICIHGFWQFEATRVGAFWGVGCGAVLATNFSFGFKQPFDLWVTNRLYQNMNLDLIISKTHVGVNPHPSIFGWSLKFQEIILFSFASSKSPEYMAHVLPSLFVPADVGKVLPVVPTHPPHSDRVNRLVRISNIRIY